MIMDWIIPSFPICFAPVSHVAGAFAGPELAGTRSTAPAEAEMLSDDYDSWYNSM